MASKKGDFESTRSGILESAITLISECGIKSTSLADIAKHAKLSKGTLYYYYPTKEHLVGDIAEYHVSRITEILFSWIESLNHDDPSEAALMSLLDALLSEESLLRLHVVLTGEAALGNAQLQKKLAAKYREWAVMLEVGSLKMASPASELVRARSKMLLLMMDGYAVERLLELEGDARAEMAALILGA